MLKEGQFSDITGVDVVAPGRFQRARGRLPLGVSLDTTLVEVQEFNIQDLIPTRYTGIVAPQYDSTSYSTPFYMHFVAADTVQYSSNVGTLTPGSLDFYVDRNAATGISLDAHDRDDLSVMIHSPPSMRGVHLVTSSSPATSITIARNLAPAFAFVDNVEGMIAEGEGLYVWPNTANANATEWWIVKSPKLYAKEGPFPAEAEGVILLANADSRNGTYKTGSVASVETFAQPNDALKMTTDLGLLTNGNHKIRVIFYKERSLRGALVTDGRKFWLLENGEYTLKLDLGDDDYLLTPWRAARIARNRILLVSPNRAPRILKLDRETYVTEDDSYAGIPAPKKPTSVETVTEDLRINPSWLVALDATGNLTGDIQVLVRAANYEDSVYSELVPAVLADNLTISSEAESATTSSFLNIPFAGNFGGVFPNSNNDDSGGIAGFTPPISPRANHIEVWRTPTSSNVFYREAILDINARAVGNETSDDVDYRQWFDPTPSQFPIRLSDANIQRQTILTSNDRDSGGLPPFCKDVVSLNDVTLCFGKASEDRVQPTLYAYNWFSVSSTYDPSDGDVTFPSDQRTEQLDNYVWQDGDELVVTFGGMDSTGAAGHLAEGVYAITQKTDANELRIASGLTTNIIGGSNFAFIHCCIRRPYTVDYPAIQSDEDVWYSRTDTFAPENFPARVKILSRTGDIFRRAVVIGDQIAVIMDQGVHLLYFNGVELVKETVANTGWGTPWKDSVIAYGDKVYWATNDSIVELSLSANPGVDGRRTHLQRIGKLQYESWFRDALEKGNAVNAGADIRNGTMRFRRDRGDNYYQSLEFSFLTNKVTLHDDDSGFRYFNSYTVEEPNSERPYFYSIDTAGRVFREHNQNLTDHYSGKILESSLGEPWIVGPTYIRHPSVAVFSELMVGEVIRFNDDIIRTINTAGPKEVTFDVVTEPIISFKIAPVRFRLRPAPVMGTDKNSDKTLHSLEIKLRPGDTTAPDSITVKGYGDLTHLDSSGTIPVYHDRDQSPDNRSSGIEAHGQSVEIELESLDTRNDFQIESIALTVREENFSTVS